MSCLAFSLLWGLLSPRPASPLPCADPRCICCTEVPRCPGLGPESSCGVPVQLFGFWECCHLGGEEGPPGPSEHRRVLRTRAVCSVTSGWQQPAPDSVIFDGTGYCLCCFLERGLFLVCCSPFLPPSVQEIILNPLK